MEVSPSEVHLRISLLIFLTALLFCGESVCGQNGKSNSNQLYREEFETYETLQRQQGIRRGGLKTRYVEFAETEFKRPSIYWPVPFLSPVTKTLQMIPARTLSQLIRQHIARNRMKQLALQNVANNPILQGVSQITELRQTPFRRWSSNNQNYQEKRRQWKVEMKKRLQGEKVPTRILPPLLISGGGQSSIHTEREPDDRYFVTYSPQTRIYQVSRRPPPFLYTTNRDILPEQLADGREVAVTTEPLVEKATKTTPQMQESTMTENPVSLQPEEPATSSIPTTSTDSPVLIVLQKAQLHDRKQEHKQFISALVKPTSSTNTLKQILFLDDYTEEHGNEEETEPDEERDKITTSTVPSITSPLSIVYALKPSTNNRRKELERTQEKLNLFQDMDDDDFLEEEDGDDDLFFFKPGGGSTGKEGEPFRILVHDQGKVR